MTGDRPATTSTDHSDIVAGAWADQHRVAVVVVNFETPELTLGCVESVLRSAGVHPRIIVVDNASGDDSVRLLRRRLGTHPSVVIVARTINDGYTGGNNAGVALARQGGARFAFLLNSDATVYPDCLGRLLAETEGSNAIALTTPRILFGHRPDLVWFGGARFSLWRGRPVLEEYRRQADQSDRATRDLPFATGCALLVNLTTVSEREGELFDASLFSYAEDVDLSLRVRRTGRRIRYVPEATVLHFEGSSHRRTGGQALRFYLDTRNLLRVAARHARWYHWITLAPMLAIDVILRYCAVAVRDRDWHQFVAVLRGAVHSMTGGTHPIERALPRRALQPPR